MVRTVHGWVTPSRHVRPLDPLSSIRMKLGAVIVAAVAVTVLVVSVGTGPGASPVVSALAAVVLSLGLVQVLAHGMTSPLREMAAAAAAMARGNYGRRVTAPSRDEAGKLARAFNGMATQLAEVDRVRRELVANVSHELRTPISAGWVSTRTPLASPCSGSTARSLWIGVVLVLAGCGLAGVAPVGPGFSERRRSPGSPCSSASTW